MTYFKETIDYASYVNMIHWTIIITNLASWYLDTLYIILLGLATFGAISCLGNSINVLDIVDNHDSIKTHSRCNEILNILYDIQILRAYCVTIDVIIFIYGIIVIEHQSKVCELALLRIFLTTISSILAHALYRYVILEKKSINEHV